MKNTRFIVAISVIAIVFIGLLILPRALNANPAKYQDETQKSALPTKVERTLKSPFEAKARIKLQELTLTADINKTAVGQATFAITEPATLRGMTFNYSDSGITVGYKGLSVNIDEKSKLATTALSAIISAIDKASSPGGVSVSQDGSALTLTGEAQGSSFSIMLDRENGSIASLSLPELELECEFEDFLAVK